MALRAFIAASLLVVAGFCRAQVAYTAGEPSAADGSEMIYKVTLATRSAAPVGSAGLYNGDSTNPITLLSGLTFGTDKKLYAIALPAKNSQPLLVTLNQASGKAAVVSTINGVPGTSTASLSLAFGCDGRLWMATSESSNSFWELTPSTGQTRLVGSLGAKITSLAVQNNVLYGFGGNGNANLYSIDPNSGQATSIGPYDTPVPNPVDGAFDAGGVLWSLVRNYNDSGGSGLPSQLNTLAQIDPTQGTMTISGTIADPNPSPSYKSRMRGFAIAPPVCSAALVDPPFAQTSSAPAVLPMNLGVLGLLLSAAACFAFRRHPH